MRPIRVLELRSVRGTGGGPEKTILTGAARADPRRVTTTVCYLRAPDDPPLTIGERAAQLGVDYVEIVERHSLDPRAWHALVRLVRDRQIQVVHAHDHRADLLGLLLKRRTGIVPLATAHGWTGSTRREQSVYFPADKRLLARYPRVISVSSEIARELVQAGAHADRIVIVPNGIDAVAWRRDPGQEQAARLRFGVPDGAIVIGSAGRLERQKRFDVLVEAVAQLRGRWPALYVLIAGEGTERAALEARLRDRLGDGWTLPGHVDDMMLAYHAMDVFVQASDYEGTSNALLEAMALMTPIVATDVGGTREMFDHQVQGLLIAPGQPDLLAGAIEQVLIDRGAARDRAVQARRLVEGPRSVETRVRRVESIVTDLVGGVAPDAM